MSFEKCCVECIRQLDFVAEFNRLTGYRLGVRTSGLTAAIDQAYGYEPDREAMPAFCRFVFEFIWMPLMGS